MDTETSPKRPSPTGTEPRARPDHTFPEAEVAAPDEVLSGEALDGELPHGDEVWRTGGHPTAASAAAGAAPAASAIPAAGNDRREVFAPARQGEEDDLDGDAHLPGRVPERAPAPVSGATVLPEHRVAAATASSAVAVVEPAGGSILAHATEPAMGEWLNRRWLFGLSYWQALLAGAFFVALLVTRFFALGDRAMHHDESMHAKFAWDTYQGQVYKYNPLLHGPFQFLAVATSFWLFGATEWTARAVPAIFGVVLVSLSFLWRRWLGAAGWLFALGIFIFSPSFTYFSRMLREDSYTATWTLLAATGLVGYVLHRRRRWYYTFCAGLAFAFATKESTYITAFIFGTFMILSLLWERANVMLQRVLAGAMAGGIVGAFWSSVMGNYKKELFEVGGALLGLVAGGALGLLHHRTRAVSVGTAGSWPAVTDGAAGDGSYPARRSRRSGQPVQAVERALDRSTPLAGAATRGTFTDALGSLWQDKLGFWGIGTFWGGVIIFFTIFVVLFSSVFTNMAGIRVGLVGSITYWLEQHGVQRGNQPWFYYLLLLSAYETLAWIFGLVATAYYLRRPTWLTSFLVWWWVVALVIYSWAGEKMPWLIIHIATPLVLLSARYLGELATSVGRNVWEKRLAFSGFALLALWTVHTGWPVNFERPDTPKDLLVYTQTAPDVKKVMQDIERISLEQTGDALGIGVSVQSGTWWPFSWYLRDFKNADYPAQLTAQATKPIVLIALEDDEKNRPFLQGYSRTKYKMRWWYPEDYRSLTAGSFVDLFRKRDVRAGLWKWLIYRDTTQPLGSYDFYVYMKDGLEASTAGVVVDGGQAGVSGGAAAAQPGQRAGAAGAAGAAAARANVEQYAGRIAPLSLVAQWGVTGRAPAQFATPRGIALDDQGNVYVADTLNHRIQKFDRTGKLLTAWGTDGSGDGQFKEPMGVALDRQGNVYVADTWNHRVQKFESTGKFITKFGAAGTGPSQPGFWGPRAVALDAQGNVYVVDTGNKRIQKFESNGAFIASIGAAGSGAGQLNEPVGLAVNPSGEIFVADTNNRRIQKFDASGAPVAQWPVGGWQSDVRTEPYLALDREGNVYVTDPPNARFIKFSPGGEVLSAGGSPGNAAGQLDVPLGIAVGDAIYLVDSGNNRVQAFALLP